MGAIMVPEVVACALSFGRNRTPAIPCNDRSFTSALATRLFRPFLTQPVFGRYVDILRTIVALPTSSIRDSQNWPHNPLAHAFPF